MKYVQSPPLSYLQLIFILSYTIKSIIVLNWKKHPVGLH